ncbi:unnamed protein product [Notodromas monacha]|uniref:C2H2-type domain-containing protein n=1 Tax=Notodromas monacha TaxID=399045 RepID=A0A7R9BHW5_9CRUS|nr:unnamed protein product [Notodromas monacha]CAG0914216.1 unnamed protein product [Notodromas monacha]
MSRWEGNVWNYGMQQGFGGFAAGGGGAVAVAAAAAAAGPTATATGPNGEAYMLAQLPPGLAVQNHLQNGVVLLKASSFPYEAEDQKSLAQGTYQHHPHSVANAATQVQTIVTSHNGVHPHQHQQQAGLVYHSFQPIVAHQPWPQAIQQQNAAPQTAVQMTKKDEVEADVKPAVVKKPRARKKKASANANNENVQKTSGTQTSAASTPGDGTKPFFPGRRLPSLATIAKECENGKTKTHFCDHCHRGFSSAYHLSRHWRIHDGDYPATCSECGKTFRDASSLKRHNFVHTRDSPHECPVCQKRFGEIASVAKILEKFATSSVRSFFSSEFFSIFGHQIEITLARHVRIHSGEYAHKCDTCDKGFHDTYALSRHQRSHTGDRPYRCHLCSKGFVTGSYLKKHLRTHGGLFLCKKMLRIPNLSSTSFRDVRHSPSLLLNILAPFLRPLWRCNNISPSDSGTRPSPWSQAGCAASVLPGTDEYLLSTVSPETPIPTPPRTLATFERRERSFGRGRVSFTSMKVVPDPQPIETAASFRDCGIMVGDKMFEDSRKPQVPCSFQPQTATAPVLESLFTQKRNTVLGSNCNCHSQTRQLHLNRFGITFRVNSSSKLPVIPAAPQVLHHLSNQAALVAQNPIHKLSRYHPQLRYAVDRQTLRQPHKQAQLLKAPQCATAPGRK